MFLEVEAVLKKGQIILSEISQYRGASKEIREVNYVLVSCQHLLVSQLYLFWIFSCTNQNCLNLSTQAISNPGEDYQEKARDAVFPLVQQLRRYYDFSLDIGMIFLFISCVKLNVFLCLYMIKKCRESCSQDSFPVVFRQHEPYTTPREATSIGKAVCGNFRIRLEI